LRAVRALRLAVQDAALSRRKHGFDSRRARQGNQLVSQTAGQMANMREGIGNG
jgi:hypothetical protein